MILAELLFYTRWRRLHPKREYENQDWSQDGKSQMMSWKEQRNIIAFAVAAIFMIP